MDRIRESRNRAPCDKIFPEIPDDGPEGYGCERSIPASGCGRKVSEICIYGKLLNEDTSKQAQKSFYLLRFVSALSITGISLDSA